MISQDRLQKLIAENKKRLDELNAVLAKYPELKHTTHPLAAEPDWTYGHYLTKLVSEKLILRFVNNDHSI